LTSIHDVLILFSPLENSNMYDDDELLFKVVRTNGHDQVLARAANLIIGRAAYETARRLFPNDRVGLSERCADHRPE
jgi:hypothetical protein